jgi:hypothetical protein
MEWEDWLKETVYSGRGQTEEDEVTYYSRARMIRLFVKEGLTPLFESHGYVFKRPPQTLCSRIATGLYENEGKHMLDSDWSIGLENTDYLPEEKDHYYTVLDRAVWDRFWSSWAHWDDVSEHNWRGLDRRADIEEYCWTQLDLDRSPQTKRILFILGIDEEALTAAEGGRNKHHQKGSDDVYIKEATESGQFGGYRK